MSLKAVIGGISWRGGCRGEHVVEGGCRGEHVVEGGCRGEHVVGNTSKGVVDACR